MAFHPYLFFGGNCRAAFTRYQEIFGGELSVMAMSDMPPSEDQPVPPDKADYVMHAALMIGDDLVMGSDDPTAEKFGPVQGMMISFSTKDVAEAKRVFDALAEGGQVSLPIGETFWSPAFGMCTDQWGTPWMIGAEGEQQG
jgi:PhnB protein